MLEILGNAEHASAAVIVLTMTSSAAALAEENTSLDAFCLVYKTYHEQFDAEVQDCLMAARNVLLCGQESFRSKTDRHFVCLQLTVVSLVCKSGYH